VIYVERRQQKMNDEKDYEIVGFDPIGNRTHKILSYLIAFGATILLCVFILMISRR
jgi:hypothetical protein